MRFPLYDGAGVQVATIDARLKLRDMAGRFLPLGSDERRALLASCRIVADASKPENSQERSS